jgi:hypothetical protein
MRRIGVSSESTDWKERSIRSLKEAIRFFSNKGKLERELWVSRTFLTRTGIAFERSELQAAEEPIDVQFRGARFQIKEAMPEGRKRQLEYSEELAKAERAKEHAELLRGYTPIELTGQQIFRICSAYSEKLVSEAAYGPREMAGIDLLVYVNYPDHHELKPHSGTINASPFRSVSYISNRYASVIYAAASAPSWLIAAVGVVSDVRPGEDDD